MQRKKSVKISGQKLYRLRASLAMSQAELGREIGMTDARVGQIEKASSIGVYPKSLRGLAKLAAKTPDEVAAMLAPEPLADLNVEPYSETTVDEPPMFNLEIAAGVMTELPDSEEMNDPRLLSAKRFRIRIRGESMEKEYPDGSIIEFVCLQHYVDGRADAIRIGEDYYVQAAESATFKRLKDFTNEEYVFAAINRRKFPEEIRLKREDVHRMARADSIIKKIPRR